MRRQDCDVCERSEFGVVLIESSAAAGFGGRFEKEYFWRLSYETAE